MSFLFGSRKKKQKEVEMMDIFIQIENEIARLNKICFKKCVKNYGSRLTENQKQCILNCSKEGIKAFEEAFKSITKTLEDLEKFK
ncbi:import inner membrane translocase subunit tim8 a [Anaeramoeba ignava]|uniref:Mitochondrial import inner membrane translocase subunit n=1 Tax=Anaeramoeba ignava TaxID=1746090 RepID=A0A9Q0RB50_ANAIG|nr:import inner membrane translocase subunit tim8 a [Anaeramoeba ignava]